MNSGTLEFVVHSLTIDGRRNLAALAAGATSRIAAAWVSTAISSAWPT